MTLSGGHSETLYIQIRKCQSNTFVDPRCDLNGEVLGSDEWVGYWEPMGYSRAGLSGRQDEKHN